MNYVVFTGIKELLINIFFTIVKKEKYLLKISLLLGLLQGLTQVTILTFICMIYLMFRGKNKKVRVASIRLQKPEKLLVIC